MSSITTKIRESICELIDLGGRQNVNKITKTIAKKLGLRDRLINYTDIEIRNYLRESRFKRVPIKKRILFLPHCLRNVEKCKGHYNDEGFECARCGACQINEILEMAEGKGYRKIFIVPGGSMIKKLVGKYKPEAIIGLACYHELTMGMDVCQGFHLPSSGILLLRDGCKDTLANMDEIEEKLDLVEGK